MDKFDEIYNTMINNYNELEEIMTYLYQQLASNPQDENIKNLFQGLGNVAKNMISTQKLFTKSYCNDELCDSLVDRLNSKQETLSNALEETKGKTI